MSRNIFLHLTRNTFLDLIKNTFLDLKFWLKWCFIITCWISYAAFEVDGFSPRAVSMGGAFSTIRGDLNSLLYNPSGLAELERHTISLSYGLIYPDLSDNSKISQNYFAYGGEILGQKIAVSYRTFGVDSLYGERTISISYAKKLRKLLLGATLKNMNLSFDFAEKNNASDNAGNKTGMPDEYFNKAVLTAYSFDAGFIIPVSRRIYAGLKAVDINQPKIGENDSVNMKLGGGVAYQHPFMNFAVDFETRKFTQNNDFEAKTGFERKFRIQNGALFFRTGFETGSRNLNRISAGGGIKINGVSIDYAFSIPLGTFKNSGIHRISISYRFAEEPPDREIQELIKEEIILRQNAELKVKEYEARIKELESELMGAKEVEKKKRIDEEKLKIEAERKKAKESYIEAYSIALKNYYKQLETDITYTRRIEILEDIISKYSQYVDVSEARAELNKAKRALEIGRLDFDTSWSFYKKIALRGASQQERKEVLERILKKYRIYGFDMSEVQEELKKLK